MRCRPAVALLALLLLTACAPRTARVATDATFPPFHYVSEYGLVTGFDVEVARTALARTGTRVKVVRVDSYAALFDGLVASEHDVVAATTGITAQRRLKYAFSRPYFTTCQAIVVRAGGPSAPADLAGARIAASPGTTSVAAAAGLSPAKILEMPVVEGVAALLEGRVDALVVDEYEAVRLARETPGLRVLPEPAALESYGLVLRHGDGLAGEIDKALEAMEADGTLAHLRERFELERPADWPVRIDP